MASIGKQNWDVVSGNGVESYYTTALSSWPHRPQFFIRGSLRWGREERMDVDEFVDGVDTVHQL